VTIDADIQQYADELMKSIEGDAPMVSSAIAGWWLEYLRKHGYRYKDMLRMLEESDKDRKILEVGSFPGHMTVLLKKLGFRNIRGVDIDPSRSAGLWAKYGISVDKVDIERENMPFDDGAFDIILFSEILEHLRHDPLHVLREINRILAPGGKMILSTPNITPLHRLGFLFGRDYQGDPVEEFGKLKWLGHMGHVRLYSADEVKRFLRNAGFTVSAVSHKGIPELRWKGSLVRLFHPDKGSFNRILYVTARK
jgi:SAM-dependent methyltransferase